MYLIFVVITLGRISIEISYRNEIIKMIKLCFIVCFSWIFGLYNFLFYFMKIFGYIFWVFLKIYYQIFSILKVIKKIKIRSLKPPPSIKRKLNNVDGILKRSLFKNLKCYK